VRPADRGTDGGCERGRSWSLIDPSATRSLPHSLPRSTARAEPELAEDRGARRAGPFPGLTDPEREILDLIAASRSNTEIARRLVVSDKIDRNVVSNMFVKLQVAGRSQAIAQARESGLAGAVPRA